MVAPSITTTNTDKQRVLRCKVIAIDAQGNIESSGPMSPARLHDADPRNQPRPSELLPWADPYIAGLVKKLQGEVRREVNAGEGATDPASARRRAPAADLEWRWDEDFTDWDTPDREPATESVPALPAGGESWNARR